MRMSIATLLALAAATPLAAGEATIPTFGAEVGLVNLAVTVTDPRANYVPGLAESDFEVLEDGVPQDVSLFAQRDVPLSVVLLLDNSLSMQPRMADAKAAARRFLGTLRPGDEVELVAFNQRSRIAEPFTSDQDRLEAALQAVRPEGATALYNALYVALKDLQARRGEGTLRREAVVVLSDGDDTSSVVSDDQVLGLARSLGVPVYGIRVFDPRVDARRDNPRRSNFFFSSVTRDTGGQAHIVRSAGQLGSVYDQLADELRSQYSLGYVSSNPRRDGAWRRIIVRMRDVLGLRSRHRTGYYAPRD